MNGARALTKRLVRCEAGASMIEFAVLAPVFFIFVFGLIESGRMLWLGQSINEVAYSTVRCMSTSSSCASNTTIKNYAVARAGSYRITLVAANVVPTANVTCDGNATNNKVAITYTVDSPVRELLPFLPETISTHACFPKLS